MFTYGPSAAYRSTCGVRFIVMHPVHGFTEHGFSVVVSYDLILSAGLGLRASVAPAWGW